MSITPAALRRVAAAAATLMVVASAPALASATRSELSVAAATAQGLAVDGLTAEYVERPLGIDVAKPRLGWRLQSQRRGTLQSAYRVLVATSPDDLREGAADVWDSGRVASGRSVGVEYAGPAQKSTTRYWWTVQVWDDLGTASGYAAPTWWETGLLQKADWTAGWIAPVPKNAQTAAVEGAMPKGVINTSAQPVPYLRTTFDVLKPVASARLYATALGVYEMHLNGGKVGNDALNPGWTDYTKWLQYQTFDVGTLLKPGKNALGGLVGNGWYAGHIGFAGPSRYGLTPSLLAQLEIRYADGTVQRVATDGSWKASTGGLRSSDLLMGEAYDARLEPAGWTTPGFTDAAWLPVGVAGSAHDVVPALVAQIGPTVQPLRELPARVRTSPAAGTYVFDLGQNFAGVVRLKVAGPAGTTVTLRHAEVLNPDGTLYVANLRAAKATDTYTLAGTGAEVYTPRFTSHGFRYVEVTGYPGVPGLDAVTGVVLGSANPDNGSFTSSDPQLNQLQSNIQWGQRSNFLSVPTDCPQRDERAGWTGDAQIFARTAMFNADTQSFYTKWLRDLNSAANSDGSYPDIAPNLGLGVSAGWGDAGVIVPWEMYLVYDDTRIINQYWSGMVAWVEYARRNSSGLIRPAAGYGDWLNLGDNTPKDQIATAYFAYSTRLLAKMAAATGRAADAEKYGRLADDIRNAYLDRWVSSSGRIVGDTQTAYVLALSMDLLPASLRQASADRLAALITQRGHLTTGFLGTRDLMPVLTSTGHGDVAYKLLNRRSYPSWRFMIERGATTMWEHWDSIRPDGSFQDPAMNSFNHYAYGAVGDWLYRSVAGLGADPQVPGYRKLLIAPQPGGGLSSASASYTSVYGPSSSSWSIDGDALRLAFTVPANATAEVRIPADTSVTEGGRELVGSGTEGLRFVRLEGGTAVFEAGSGTYSLVSDAGDRFPAGGGTDPDPEPQPTVPTQPTGPTLDYVDLGDTLSETTHNLAASSGGTNAEAGRSRRYTGERVKSGYFEFDLKITQGKAFVLRTVETYDATARIRDYDVLVNGKKVHSRAYAHPGGTGLIAYVVTVSDPTLLTGGTVRVRYQEDAEGVNSEPSISDAWSEPVPAA